MQAVVHTHVILLERTAPKCNPAKPPHHEQDQNVYAMQQGRIRDVPRPIQAGEDVVLFVQALGRRGEGGQPLLPVRRHVERVAEVGVEQVTVFFVFGCLPKCP